MFNPFHVVSQLQSRCQDTLSIQQYYLRRLSLQWRLNERDGVSNHRRFDWLLNRLFRCRSKQTSKLRVTALCEGPLWGVIREFLAQRASNAEYGSIWRCHHVISWDSVLTDKDSLWWIRSTSVEYCFILLLGIQNNATEDCWMSEIY